MFGSREIGGKVGGKFGGINFKKGLCVATLGLGRGVLWFKK